MKCFLALCLKRSRVKEVFESALKTSRSVLPVRGKAKAETQQLTFNVIRHQLLTEERYWKNGCCVTA
ncbi:hypothetical protein ATANTOWER_003158 [Ataeniobius toweri]|uniref:Uncharacterized protein n=1 Tax=Ataeniobius toweri TaxID=208326 RepID=A0ABU7BGC2_9TELE|nr:hypothetical protein [Ataeniobius toweri]